ncbi:MAG: TonB-dependent receptor [Candidatus Marinimicrobia bacterium]|nr:TonB-dependent receptor [Candidatus Neomarinimicrobiota bacterium]
MKPILTIIVLSIVMNGVTFAGTSGKIVGMVIDEETGQPLIGANIILKGTSMGAAADITGRYMILNVPPGRYILIVRMIGYGTVEYENLRVSIDLTTSVDFSLTTRAVVGEVVTVIGKTPLIRLDLTSSSVSISAEQIEALPVDNFTDIIALQAGIVEGHFRGGRAGEVLYLVDGIPVNDVFSGDFAFQVENNAIQEMEIISGTFNAEYGQVQSGVVNVLTKEGGQEYSAQFSTYFGDYISGNDNIFQNIDDLSPTAINDLKVSLSGPFPILSKNLTFFVSGRQNRNEGFLYGKTIYNPSVITSITDTLATVEIIDLSGQNVIKLSDWQYQSMNSSERNSYQGKLTYVFNPETKKDKLNFDASWQEEENLGANYNHLFRYSPDGMRKRNKTSWTGGIRWSRIVSPNTYFTLNFHHLQNRLRDATFEDPLDPLYASDDRLRQRGNFSFYTGGTDMRHRQRETRTTLAKFDFTSQINSEHQLRGGIEGKFHRLWFHEISVRKNAGTAFQSQIPIEGTAFNQEYIHKPKEYSAYIQDKIELEFLIVNAGIRLDVFNPADSVLQDFSRPQEIDINDPTKSIPRFGDAANSTYQLSPRFGIAYPITDRGVIHVSYGHFFQTPLYEFLYTNPSFSLNTSEGRASVFSAPFGNANLKPQKTVSYEIGLQQQVSEEIAIDVTGYYKDIRNLLGTKIETIATGETHSGTKYGRYINRDYGNVKGLIFSIEKRRSNNFSATLDYTLQIAAGNASDPKSVLIDNAADPPVQSEKQLVPLDWDRTHSITSSVALGSPKAQMISLIGKMGTGLPYTPAVQDQRTGLENSERRPITITFDLSARKIFSFHDYNLTAFIRVFNLFDRLNEREVYKDTGRATYSLAQNLPGLVQGLNSKEEYFLRPDWYSSPREVNIGITIDIK